LEDGVTIVTVLRVLFSPTVALICRTRKWQTAYEREKK